MSESWSLASFSLLGDRDLFYYLRAVQPTLIRCELSDVDLFELSRGVWRSYSGLRLVAAVEIVARCKPSLVVPILPKLLLERQDAIKAAACNAIIGLPETLLSSELIKLLEDLGAAPGREGVFARYVLSVLRSRGD